MSVLQTVQTIANPVPLISALTVVSCGRVSSKYIAKFLEYFAYHGTANGMTPPATPYTWFITQIIVYIQQVHTECIHAEHIKGLESAESPVDAVVVSHSKCKSPVSHRSFDKTAEYESCALSYTVDSGCNCSGNGACQGK